METFTTGLWKLNIPEGKTLRVPDKIGSLLNRVIGNSKMSLCILKLIYLWTADENTQSTQNTWNSQ